VPAEPPETEVWYLALRRLLIPNGPGKTPGTLRVAVGQRFGLDGDEPIDMAALLRQGAVRLYGGTPEEDAFIEGEREKRQIAEARPRLRRTRG
jgi:hypothetical protein